jgi:hypothetical protein
VHIETKLYKNEMTMERTYKKVNTLMADKRTLM